MTAMTTKKATFIASKINLGLAATDLTPTINTLVNNDEKAFDMVLNAYRQRTVEDELDELLTPTVNKTTRKAKVVKPAAKKSAKPAKKVTKVAQKAVSKAPKGPSRVQRMFEHVLAGLSNEAGVQAIKREFGKDVPTNTSSLGWCRSQLKAKTDYAKKYNPKGLKVLTDKEAQEK